MSNDIKRGAREYTKNRNYLYQTSTCIICGQVLKHQTWKICKSCADFIEHQTDKYKRKRGVRWPLRRLKADKKKELLGRLKVLDSSTGSEMKEQ